MFNGYEQQNLPIWRKIGIRVWICRRVWPQLVICRGRKQPYTTCKMKYFMQIFEKLYQFNKYLISMWERTKRQHLVKLCKTSFVSWNLGLSSFSQLGPLCHPRMTSTDNTSPQISRWEVVTRANLIVLWLINCFIARHSISFGWDICSILAVTRFNDTSRQKRAS